MVRQEWSNMTTVHKSVLLHEVIENLVSKSIRSSVKTVTYLDGTLGGCGHALAVSQSLKGNLNIIGLDMDARVIDRARDVLTDKCRKLILEKSNFRKMKQVLSSHKVANVDMILLDLGLSSDELESSGRGFTFQKDEPLFMTMGDPREYAFTAIDIVNDWQEGDIANVIFGYGEERYARRIARNICEYRLKKKIETTFELRDIVKMSVPFTYRTRKLHPATKTFQALRIAVNDELKAIEDGLVNGYELLNNGGRMAIISFHSLEDRIVKKFMKSKEELGANVVTKKPIVASDGEISENPRSRSAKLRVIEKINI